MNYFSQAGQDRFVEAVMGGKPGFFVEIGSCHPIEINNTYGLEQAGWTGVMIDRSEHAVKLCREVRKARVELGDAMTFDWKAALADAPHMIDYASVDVDECTHEALKRLLESGHGFRVLTIEHDAYQRGDLLRIPNREIMKLAGYDLLCADVKSTGCAFEDWYVAPYPYLKADLFERFRSVGLEWTEVLKQGGIQL